MLKPLNEIIYLKHRPCLAHTSCLISIRIWPYHPLLTPKFSSIKILYMCSSSPTKKIYGSYSFITSLCQHAIDYMFWKLNLCWVKQEGNQLPHIGGWSGRAWGVADSTVDSVIKELESFCPMMDRICFTLRFVTLPGEKASGCLQYPEVITFHLYLWGKKGYLTMVLQPSIS